MNQFLKSCDVVDWKHPDVITCARAIALGMDDPVVIAKRCFEWVRDEIKHSRDYGLQPVTCSASAVLLNGSGYCYAKSHLLAALLRANGIPAGLCYQRLSRDDNGEPYSLHGLNAVLLPEFGWYRVDPRGNRKGVNARFTPPVEQLAFPISLPGEADLPEIWADPLPVVVEALRTHESADTLWEELPDVILLKQNVVPNQGVHATRNRAHDS
jgi:transglutaminase-like putative cysteine protease